MMAQGTAGTGIWDPDNQRFQDINGDCNDTGDSVPDGDGIDSQKERMTYLSEYGVKNNDMLFEGG